MTIKKDGKVYTVRENKASWTVSKGEGRVSVSYNVPKSVCETFDALTAYITESNLF